MVRRNRLQYLKSGKAYKTLGVVGANAKAARILGIGDDPAAINGNARVNNKMAKYVRRKQRRLIGLHCFQSGIENALEPDVAKYNVYKLYAIDPQLPYKSSALLEVTHGTQSTIDIFSFLLYVAVTKSSLAGTVT